jgi:hypothetical protein
MKSKYLFTLSALLFAPLLSQAEWINTHYWPYIYRHNGNTWEYSYTADFWTCNYFTGEYTHWGELVSSLAPESLIEFNNLYIDGGNAELWQEDGSYAFYQEGRPSIWDILSADYRVLSPDTARIIMLGKRRVLETLEIIVLDLKFLAPNEGTVTYSHLSEGFEPWSWSSDFVLNSPPW